MAKTKNVVTVLQTSIESTVYNRGETLRYSVTYMTGLGGTHNVHQNRGQRQTMKLNTSELLCCMLGLESVSNSSESELIAEYSFRGITVCVCVLPSHLFWTSDLWTRQPGSHKRKVTRDFASTFLLRCLPYFLSREGFSHSFPSPTVKSNLMY